MTAARLRLILLIIVFWSGTSAAVQPETGWYWVPGEPGRGYYVEAQAGTVAVGVLAYDENGNPVWYVAAGPYDGEFFSGELLRFAGGQCLGCDYQPPDAPQSLGTIIVHFRFRCWALVTLGDEEFWMQRQWFGTNVVVSNRRGQDVLDMHGQSVVFPSLLGQWIFVNENTKPPTVYSYDFTEVEERPSEALDAPDMVLFTDQSAKAVFLCHTSTGVGFFWEIPACILLEGDLPFPVGDYEVVLSVGFRDIGTRGMLAYEGPFVGFDVDRGENLIQGYRVQ